MQKRFCKPFVSFQPQEEKAGHQKSDHTRNGNCPEAPNHTPVFHLHSQPSSAPSPSCQSSLGMALCSHLCGYPISQHLPLNGHVFFIHRLRCLFNLPTHTITFPFILVVCTGISRKKATFFPPPTLTPRGSNMAFCTPKWRQECQILRPPDSYYQVSPFI